MNADSTNTKVTKTVDKAKDLSKKTKQQSKGNTDATIKDDAIIDNSVVTTEINGRKYDIRARMKIMGATEEQILESVKPFQSAIGPGSMSDSIGNVIKSAAKVMRWQQKIPSQKQTMEMIKIGLTPEEWLFLCTALATQEGFDDKNVSTLLSYDEIIDLMIVLNRAAYTPPEVPCTKIKNNKSKATFTSSCWYGAQQALGSWYPNEKNKKKITPNIDEALRLAEANKHTNSSKTVTPTSDSKKRKQATNKEEKSRKKSGNGDTTDSSENDDDMDVLSSSSESELEITRVLKAKKSDRMDVDEDEEDDEDSESEHEGVQGSVKQNSKQTTADQDSDDEDDDEDMYSVKDAATSKEQQQEQHVQSDQSKQVNNPVVKDADKKKPKAESQKKKVTVNGIPTNKLSKGESADTQAARRKLQVRLQLMLKLKSSKKTPAQVVVKHLHKLYETIRHEDRRAMIMPWLSKDSATHTGITKVEDLPEKFSDWKIYVDKCRPKKDSDVWVKMRFAGSLNPEEYTSSNGSSISFWYDEYEHRGYLCPIQNSDTIKTAGVLLYSGPFCDPVRLTSVIEQEMKTKNPNKEWKIGVRIRKCIEMAKIEVQHQDGYVMQDNQPAAVMADATQAKEIANYLYRRFNSPQENVGRPGEYDFRFLPEKEFTTTGSNGKQDRQNIFKKHRAVIASSRLTSTFTVKNLDLELDLSHLYPGMTCMTLRHEILSWTYPLVLPKNASPPGPGQKLIRTVDFAYNGPDAGAKVYATAYEDRFEIAERIMGILPNFIQWKYNADVAKEWCGHVVEMNEVEFHKDDEGNWNGSWTTEDDKLHALMLQEDVGYKLQFDNMQMIQQEERKHRKILRTDNASLASLQMNELDGQTQASATSTVYENGNDSESVAASSSASGGSGLSS